MRSARAIFVGIVLAAAGSAPSRGQMLDRLWARLLPRCEAYSVAPNGSVIVSSDWDGTVQSHAEDGHVLWRLKFARQMACVPSNGGSLYVAYAPNDRDDRRVYLLDSAGRTLRIETAPGPVRTVAVSDDGSMAVALSEPSRITVLRRVGRGWRWQRRLLPGTATSLSVDSAGERIVVSHRGPGGITLLDRALKVLWTYRNPTATSYRVQMSSNGAVLAALTLPGPGGVQEVLYWRTASSIPVWKHTLPGDLAHIGLAPDGKYLVAGYRTRLWRRKKSVVEPRVSLFSNTGRNLWAVGGLMFGAHLIGATSSPLLVLTHDNARVLAALDKEGHMRARHRLLAPIRSCVMSRDSTHIAVMSDARVLYLFRARR